MKGKYLYVGFALIIVFGFLIVNNKADNASQIRNNTNDTVITTGLNIGDMAPSFRVTTIDNKTISSDDLKGKIIVLTSSAAWCQTCVMEALQFSAVYPKYKYRDVYFLTTDIDPNVTMEQIRQFRQNTFSPWDYAGAQGGVGVIRAFRFNRFEITYIIDGNGVIRHKDNHITNADELEEALNNILNI